uniref:Uncharacterized protein n=1 Tax=Equus asinus TaxID=9793 RepID=A0A9L0KF75_EQUAS
GPVGVSAEPPRRRPGTDGGARPWAREHRAARQPTGPEAPAQGGRDGAVGARPVSLGALRGEPARRAGTQPVPWAAGVAGASRHSLARAASGAPRRRTGSRRPRSATAGGASARTRRCRKRGARDASLSRQPGRPCAAPRSCVTSLATTSGVAPEYPRPLAANTGRHFRCLLPRRRPAGVGATLLASSSPAAWGSRCLGSATRRWRAVVTCSASWTTTRSRPCATPSPTAWCSLTTAKEKEDKKAEKVDFHRLGEEFCHWFFQLLNSQNPFLGPPQDEWGPQHFWHDVKLRFYYKTSEQNVIDYHGADIVSLRLLSLVKEEYLFLSPNLDSRGLKCASSPHGLVMVGVAGTVHRGNSCLGIFEQIFGLIRCPFVENTWKIKFINLRIIGEGSLAPGKLMEPAITFEPSDLEAFHNVITLCGTNEVYGLM